MTALRLRSIRPIESQVTTSFGIMRDRLGVLVRAEDQDGVVGWVNHAVYHPAERRRSA